MKLCCLVFRSSILALFVLLLLLILTVLEVEVDTTYVVPWNLSYLFKDIERYVIIISLLLCYAVKLPTLAIGMLSTFTLEWIFSAPVFSV